LEGLPARAEDNVGVVAHAAVSIGRIKEGAVVDGVFADGPDGGAVRVKPVVQGQIGGGERVGGDGGEKFGDYFAGGLGEAAVILAEEVGGKEQRGGAGGGEAAGVENANTFGRVKDPVRERMNDGTQASGSC
jgi:hypothetical protein